MLLLFLKGKGFLAKTNTFPLRMKKTSWHSVRGIFFFLFFTSAIVLTTSLVAEFFFHLQVCKLCHFQRLPYLLVLVVSAYGLYSRHNEATLRTIQACFAAGTFLAGYHSAVILGIVNDPCIVQAHLTDLQSFKALMEAPLPCSVSGWRIFHVPIPVFNTLLSLGLVAFIQLVQGERKRGRPSTPSPDSSTS